MCDKTVDRNASAIKYVTNWCKTQKMCDKALDRYTSTIEYVSDWCKIQ